MTEQVVHFGWRASRSWGLLCIITIQFRKSIISRNCFSHSMNAISWVIDSLRQSSQRLWEMSHISLGTEASWSYALDRRKIQNAERKSFYLAMTIAVRKNLPIGTKVLRIRDEDINCLRKILFTTHVCAPSSQQRVLCRSVKRYLRICWKVSGENKSWKGLSSQRHLEVTSKSTDRASTSVFCNYLHVAILLWFWFIWEQMEYFLHIKVGSIEHPIKLDKYT